VCTTALAHGRRPVPVLRAVRAKFILPFRQPPVLAARQADQIVALHEGRIVEHGNHDELVGKYGLYAGRFSLQASGYQ